MDKSAYLRQSHHQTTLSQGSQHASTERKGLKEVGTFAMPHNMPPGDTSPKSINALDTTMKSRVSGTTRATGYGAKLGLNPVGLH